MKGESKKGKKPETPYRPLAKHTIRRSLVWLRLIELVDSGDIVQQPYRVVHADWRDHTGIVTRAAGGPTMLLYKNLRSGTPKGAHWLLPWTAELRARGLLKPYERLDVTACGTSDAEDVEVWVGVKSQVDAIAGGYAREHSHWTPPRTPSEYAALQLRWARREMKRRQ